MRASRITKTIAAYRSGLWGIDVQLAGERFESSQVALDRHVRRIKRQDGVRYVPPLTVPAQFPSWAKPDLRAGTSPDALRQFRPKPLEEIGQPYPHGARPVLELQQDVRFDSLRDDIAQPLDDAPPRT